VRVSPPPDGSCGSVHIHVGGLLSLAGHQWSRGTDRVLSWLINPARYATPTNLAPEPADGRGPLLLLCTAVSRLTNAVHVRFRPKIAHFFTRYLIRAAGAASRQFFTRIAPCIFIIFFSHAIRVHFI